MCAVFVAAARQYTEQVLGGPCTEIDSFVTATNVAASLLVPNNGDRVALIFMNLGANDVWIAPNPNVSINLGIRVSNSGGSVTLNVTEDFTLMTRDWYGVTQSGSSIVYILEIDRFTKGSAGA